MHLFPFFLLISISTFLAGKSHATLLRDWPGSTGYQIRHFLRSPSSTLICYYLLLSGAIIGDGDRKRALILLLGLSPWYGTIFLFLEQIAPSPVAHARTWRLLRGFLGTSGGGKDVSNHRNVWYLWPTTAYNSIRSCLLELCFSIFAVSCSSLSEVRQCWI